MPLETKAAMVVVPTTPAGIMVVMDARREIIDAIAAVAAVMVMATNNAEVCLVTLTRAIHRSWYALTMTQNK